MYMTNYFYHYETAKKKHYHYEAGMVGLVGFMFMIVVVLILT